MSSVSSSPRSAASSSSTASATSTSCSSHSSAYAISLALPVRCDPARYGSVLKFVDDPFENDPALLSDEDEEPTSDSPCPASCVSTEGDYVADRFARALPDWREVQDGGDRECQEDAEREDDDGLLPLLPAEPSFDDVFAIPVRLPSDDSDSQRRSALRLASLPALIASVSASQAHLRSLSPDVFMSVAFSALQRVDLEDESCMPISAGPVVAPAAQQTLPLPSAVREFLAAGVSDAVPTAALRAAVYALCAPSTAGCAHAGVDGVLHAAVPEPPRKQCDGENDDESCGVALRATQLLAAAAERDMRVAAHLATDAALCRVLCVARRHARNPLIQACVLAVFTPMLRSPGAIAPFVARNGVEAVVWALEAFRAIRPVVTHAATILRLVARGVGNAAPVRARIRVRVARIGALSALAVALTRWSVAPRVQATVIAAVTTIVRGSATCQWIAGRSQLIEPIVVAMRAAPHELFFQMVGAHAVAALCEADWGNRVCVFDAHFLPHAALVLRLFGEDAALAAALLAALAQAATDLPGMQDAFVASGALVVVLRAAHLHAANATIVAATARVLQYALRSQLCRAAMPSCDGVDALVDALARGIARVDVVDPVLSAIANALSTLSPSCSTSSSSSVNKCASAEKTAAVNACRFVSIDGPCVVTDAMHRHVEQEVVQWHGVRALRNAAAAILLPPPVAHAVVDAVLVALMGQRYHVGVQEDGCELLVHIAKAGDTVDYMLKAGVADLIDVTRTFHASVDAIQRQADILLTVLRGSTLPRRDLASISGSLLERIRSMSESKRSNKR